ncbi:hypothetical protein Dimus_022779, partial [Dionaea muscipula]
KRPRLIGSGVRTPGEWSQRGSNPHPNILYHFLLPSLSLPSSPLSSSTLLAATNSPLNCGTSAPPPPPPHSSSVSSLLKHQASPPLTSPYSDRRSVEFLK